jgi:hypothetical protein
MRALGEKKTLPENPTLMISCGYAWGIDGGVGYILLTNK